MSKPHLTPEKRKSLEIELLEAKAKKIDLAKKYGITRQQVNNIERKLRKVSRPLVAIQQAESLRQVDKVVTDTNAVRQRYLEMLDKDLNGKLKPKDKSFVMATAGKLLDGMDRARIMEAHLGGAGATAGEMECCQTCPLRQERKVTLKVRDLRKEDDVKPG